MVADAGFKSSSLSHGHNSSKSSQTISAQSTAGKQVDGNNILCEVSFILDVIQF